MDSRYNLSNIPYTPIWYIYGEVINMIILTPAAAEALKSQVETLGKSLDNSLIRLHVTAG